MLIDTPLGQHLLAEGLISQEQLDAALHHHEAHRMRLGSAIVELGYVSPNGCPTFWRDNCVFRV